MIIGSKLPPVRGDTTYFNLGRSAFAYLTGEIVKPKKVYLPAYLCWSFVSTMHNRFPDIELEFYPVDKCLKCYYPDEIKEDELFVFIHYFGKENRTELPPSRGVILEDISHAMASKINYRGDYVFGSLRKVFRIADGGIIKSHFNPIYEPSKKLDTWLRYEARDWRDMREAENMTDRKWEIADISSKSLEIFLTSNLDAVRLIRLNNDKFLSDRISVGKHLLSFDPHEAPLVHNRVFDTKEERDSLKSYLESKGIYTSIYWPTHEIVKKSKVNTDDVMWLEEHILSFPVSQEYNLNDMEYIADSISRWG